jgi:phage-related minor tail protein
VSAHAVNRFIRLIFSARNRSARPYPEHDMADETLDIGTDGDLSGTVSGLQMRTRDLTTGANSFARAMTTAFARSAASGKSFDDVLKSLTLRLSDLSLRLALRPVTNALGSGLNNLFGGLLGASGTSDTDLLKAMNTAQPFASGGVIASPSYFPLGPGLGLAGEAGPEAIMPLARGSDGRLGVAASGAAGTNVTVNIATPDAESFRRSETYLTGLVARAVARGQRGM